MLARNTILQLVGVVLSVYDYCITVQDVAGMTQLAGSSFRHGRNVSRSDQLCFKEDFQTLTNISRFTSVREEDQEFHNLLAKFYKLQYFDDHIGFVNAYTHVLQRTSLRRDRSSYAILLATLLRVEELVPLRSFESILSFVADVVFPIFRNCVLYKPQEFHLWDDMIRESFRRINALIRKRIQNTVSIDFVVCLCGAQMHGPGLFHAETTDNLFWLKDILQDAGANAIAGYSNRVRVFLMEKCRQRVLDVSELTERYESLIGVIRPFVSSVVVEEVPEELRADDCTAYLLHMDRRHGDYADYTFFTHPDIEEHAPLEMVSRLVRGILAGYVDPQSEADIQFLYLSFNFMKLAKLSNNLWETSVSDRLWNELFGGNVSPPRISISAYCCSQFVVSRKRMMLRSRSFYERAYRLFASHQSYLDLSPMNVVTRNYDVICRTPCQMNMLWWHAYFGEDLKSLKRWRDPRIPLFARLSVVELDYSFD